MNEKTEGKRLSLKKEILLNDLAWKGIRGGFDIYDAGMSVWTAQDYSRPSVPAVEAAPLAPIDRPVDASNEETASHQVPERHGDQVARHPLDGQHGRVDRGPPPRSQDRSFPGQEPSHRKEKQVRDAMLEPQHHEGADREDDRENLVRHAARAIGQPDGETDQDIAGNTREKRLGGA